MYPYTIAMTHPDCLLALYAPDGALVKDGFPSWHTAELAAANLDAIADCASDPPMPDEPIPTNVGDDPPPWCRACNGAHPTYHCPDVRALLFR